MNPRLAAGVGVVSAFLLLGGSGAAVAFATPGDHGGRGSESGEGSEHGNNGSKGDDKNDGKNDDATDDVNDDGDNNGSRQDIDDIDDDQSASGHVPLTRVGSGRDDQDWMAPGGARVSSKVEATEPIEVPTEEPGATGATGPTERSSSDFSPTSRAGFEAPRVTFGNGRIPSGPVTDRESPSGGSAPEPAPVAPPPPPPPPVVSPPSWVDTFSAPPIVTKQMIVSPAADVTDPLWGIAGLLLIPAAGAILGYRQARASQAVERLRRG